MQSQNQQIIKALMSGREITPLDALAEFGCFRLGARIHDLKNQGYEIRTEMVKGENGKRFAKYRLAEACVA